METLKAASSKTAPDSCRICVGCALAAQLRAHEQTWRDKHATYDEVITNPFVFAQEREDRT